ncbi:hypothetical protein KUTeg_006242 [Tegillarca granosa]|uniref:Hemicentin-1-like von Willebrand factor A domain-containing protein n=1 Tax=Tegillarca granosa TaxID=220873 RepID=A0ABQ9FKJ0_TEGGR|nr:hypothetical protein KUTeg_006242 [Tegillarca granosa]
MLQKSFYIVGVGLLHAIGSALFGDLLNLHATCYNCLDPKLSLTFVIDNTGSMGDDIAAVRKTSIDIVNQASLTGGVANYVLATFNDPVTKNTIRKTQDGNIFINWLQNLRATGGGDCPEFAMRGLLDVI